MSYHLVQRCKAPYGNPDPSRGFDGFFRLDYMGSAEFEFGAIPDSLKRMRAADDLTRKHRDITIDGVTRRVFFVGSLATLKVKADQFEEWAAKGFRGKESSYFPELFADRHPWRPESPAPQFMTEVELWWALNEDVMFALDHNTADRALEALATKARR